MCTTQEVAAQRWQLEAEQCELTLMQQLNAAKFAQLTAYNRYIEARDRQLPTTEQLFEACAAADRKVEKQEMLLGIFRGTLSGHSAVEALTSCNLRVIYDGSKEPPADADGLVIFVGNRLVYECASTPAGDVMVVGINRPTRA
jgi:hypothetical protein